MMPVQKAEVTVSPHIRAHLQIVTQNDVIEFINSLCEDGLTDHFDLENFDGTQRVNARSLLGVLYATSEFADQVYLVNIDNDGEFPVSIDKFRA